MSGLTQSDLKRMILSTIDELKELLETLINRETMARTKNSTTDDNDDVGEYAGGPIPRLNQAAYAEHYRNPTTNIIPTPSDETDDDIDYDEL